MNTAKRDNYPQMEIERVSCRKLSREFAQSGAVIIRMSKSDGHLLLYGLSLREQGDFQFGESLLEGLIVLIVKFVSGIPKMGRLFFAKKPIKEVIKFQHMQYGKVKYLKRIRKDGLEIVLYDPRCISRAHFI